MGTGVKEFDGDLGEHRYEYAEAHDEGDVLDEAATRDKRVNEGGGCG
jgi:hypothetical protein